MTLRDYLNNSLRLSLFFPNSSTPPFSTELVVGHPCSTTHVHSLDVAAKDKHLICPQSSNIALLLYNSSAPYSYSIILVSFAFGLPWRIFATSRQPQSHLDIILHPEHIVGLYSL